MRNTFAESGKYIPGIYNYCDRRCEACPLSHRCYSYAREKEQEKHFDDSDDSAWIKIVRENMNDAMVLLEKSAGEAGMDLKREISEEKLVETINKDRKRTDDHPLALTSREYWESCKAFFDNRKNITDDARRLAREAAMGIKSMKEVKKEMKEITQSLETVQWYMFFIEAKLQRALSGIDQHDEMPDVIDKIQNDSNGSAKIALIAIDKSISCWQLLMKKMSTAEDVSIHCLGLLEKIKRMAMSKFPVAMDFKRPGFDD
jgi:hypothetical protein